MSKAPAKAEVKKVFIRNSAKAIPKTRYIVENPSEKPKPASTNPTPKSVETQREKFKIPELQSTIRIARQIDKIEKAKPSQLKTVQNPPFDLNLTKKVNFPLDHAIYKDLMPLHVAQQTQKTLTVRDPLPMKDLEPDLDDFAKPIDGKEFRYKSSIKCRNMPIMERVNNLRLSKILQIQNE